MKLAIIYNMCGLSGLEDENQYIRSIESILSQDISDSKIALSSCCNDDFTRAMLVDIFGERVDHLYIDEVLPVPVTFNKSCQWMTDKYGAFDGFLYIDSGITFTEPNQISRLYELFAEGGWGMVSAQTTNDTGYAQNLGVGRFHDDHSENWKLFQNGHYTIPVGKGVNLHVQIFSGKLFDYYNRKPYTDIFASYCSESVFTMMCAALGLQWVIHKDVIVEHIRRLDSNSAGFSPNKWIATGKPIWEHGFLVGSLTEIIKSGVPYGAMLEECQSVIMHNPECYTDNVCNNEFLAPWVRDNMFVPKELLDYDKIEVKSPQHVN